MSVYSYHQRRNRCQPSGFRNCIMNPFDYYTQLPMGRYMEGVMNNAFNDFDRSLQSVAPYWYGQPSVRECNIGNAVGDVVNDKTKFGVQMDVSQFHPSELSVNVCGQELIIEGHHNERSDGQGKIERHFVRKYTIPDDVLVDTIESELSDKGVLSVLAKKQTSDGKAVARNIPIKAALKENGDHN